MSIVSLRPHRVAQLVLVPTILLTVIGVYGSMLWTLQISFTSSGLLPTGKFIGLEQYFKLFEQDRWHVSYRNMFVLGGIYMFTCLAFGLLLAIAMDQGVRAKNVLQTIFLYPIALSFIVTGLAWRWVLNPTTGLEYFVQGLGFSGFKFNLLNNPELAIFTLVIAAVWHGSGLMMAIIFAGLQSVDSELWRASRVDGIPKFTMYRRVILPMLLPVFLTCIVLLAMGVVKSYDLVVAMTGGGPGYSTDLPAKFVVDHLFDRANIGRASAAAVLMLLTVIALLVLSSVATRLRKHSQSDQGAKPEQGNKS
ncbi:MULTISPECIES: sugar ABC transporter permease [unclassified Devosia]|uniref:carbohydrate ABC transporter permease n=1 Tax=unclassified Devosia TaxID=196773 RepID=UPI00086B9E8A|nr:MULTISPECIES: sugar ABC transporter permease [unclassified Devosia]MBN9364403.1 sugar ABC transporter permease [Devosia sp.]ODS87024.1 MAG: sugar ABC transporter permease [Devosia sp. SCN 66-27]OJX20810.1 MAG: sugar ABC transporter permease [Devosia sp. 66-14]